jgi:lysophospholipase L1-like esterase
VNVLLLGDSHTVGGYGSELERLLKARGDTVTRVAHVGAAAGDYLTGKYASEYAALKGKPFDVVVISLGTNDAAASDYIAPSKTAERIKALADGLTSRATWYVGPPSFSANAARTYNPAFAGPPGSGKDLNTRAAKVFDAVQPVFGDRAIDPRAATLPFVKETDIHLGQQGGAAWAAAVFSRVNGAPLAPGAPVPGGLAPVSSGPSPVLVLGALALAGAAFWWWRRKR